MAPTFQHAAAVTNQAIEFGSAMVTMSPSCDAALLQVARQPVGGGLEPGPGDRVVPARDHHPVGIGGAPGR